MERATYHPVVEAFLKDIPATVKRAKANHDFLVLCDRIEAEFKDSFYYGKPGALVKRAYMVFNFAKFSEAKRLLRFMAENGQKREGKVIENKHSQQMVWRFERFEITGQFKEEKAACHYVKVGTRTVEEDIYELQCPETIDPQFKAVETVAEVDGDGMPF